MKSFAINLQTVLIKQGVDILYQTHAIAIINKVLHYQALINQLLSLHKSLKNENLIKQNNKLLSSHLHLIYNITGKIHIFQTQIL